MVETTETTASSEAKEAPSKPAAPKRAATPQALELIKKNKLDIDEIEGSGNFGRIVVDDVNDFLKTKETVGEEDDKNDKLAAAVDAAATKSVGNEEKEDEETSGLELDSIEILMPSFTQVPLQDKFVRFTEKQQDMASKSEASLQIPTFRVSREIKMDRFHALFQSLKSEGVSVTSLLAKAVALSVQEHPVINSSFDEGGGLMYKGDINVAMAVATPDGVITPTIKNTNLKSVQEISTMWKDLVRKARAGTLRPEEHQNRTITITNLSMYDVTNFDALLEEGQGTVVAIGAMQEKFVESEDSMLGYAASKTMIVTVACDHRQIYGADAALFLTSLASIMEKRLDALLE
uniref:Peripheral subunit-binding (PSBD) domain-containing protein n=1 Tax=Craspedostauros australis TaxID=1486917 RepID=A0A7R9ZLQ8_9STRA